MIDFGTVRPGTTLYIPFATYDSNDPSASVTLTGLATTDIEVYKNGSTTQRSSDAGYALLDTDGIDFDTTTGIHGFSIDLADNTDSGFYVAGAQYWVVVASVTVDAATINFIAATFRIGYPDALVNTTIATLASQTSFTLTAGPAEDDALNGCVVAIHDIASAVQMGHAVVNDYTGSTKTVTLTAGTTFTAAAGDNISIFPPANTRWIGTTAQTGANVGSKAAQIYSDTTIIYSDTTIATSKTTQIYSDTAITSSKAVQVYSDTTAITTTSAQAASKGVQIYSDTTVTTSKAVQIYSDTTIIYSDTTRIHSDTTAIEAAGGSLTAAQDSKLTRVNSKATQVYSDTTAIEAGGGALTGAQASQLAAAKSKAVQIYSDTTIIYSDTTIATSKAAQIYSDTAITSSKAVQVYSDTTALGTQATTIASDLVQVYSDTTIIASKAVQIYSDTTIVYSDTTIATSKATQIYSDTTALGTQATTIASDLVQVYSDTTITTSKATQIYSDTTTIASDLVLVYSDTAVISSDAAVIEAAAAYLPDSPAKNAAFTYTILLVDDTDHVTPKTGRTVTMTRSLDGAAFGAATGTVTEISSGVYKVAASAADMNGDVVTHLFTATDTDQVVVTLKTVS